MLIGNNRRMAVGEKITISQDGKSRKGRIVPSCEHRWFSVEFRGNFWNPFTGKYDTYRECFYWNPASAANPA